MVSGTHRGNVGGRGLYPSSRHVRPQHVYQAPLYHDEALHIQKVKRKRRVLRYVLLAAAIVIAVLWLIISSLGSDTSDTFNAVADAL